ncbi:MAG: metallopeptidase family protein [Phycisphaerales bacterium]|nr:metallopeptidase family protein [Phycisphaerae bacterium]NNF44492.1 metallopeptidase family protein [Phycisphaerales bacterium]NNM26705.1 metallopeptidase family protein [Phycisphaerales bacterium]
MNEPERDRFDAILETVIESLPPRIRGLLEEAPVIVEDHPDPRIMAEMDLDPETDVLCGLHTGTPITERSVMDFLDEPETIHLFREGILEEAGTWTHVEREIRITLLHEIGHHFGLDEEDLTALGYE